MRLKNIRRESLINYFLTTLSFYWKLVVNCEKSFLFLSCVINDYKKIVQYIVLFSNLILEKHNRAKKFLSLDKQDKKHYYRTKYSKVKSQNIYLFCLITKSNNYDFYYKDEVLSLKEQQSIRYIYELRNLYDTLTKMFDVKSQFIKLLRSK